MWKNYEMNRSVGGGNYLFTNFFLSRETVHSSDVTIYPDDWNEHPAVTKVLSDSTQLYQLLVCYIQRNLNVIAY